MCILCRNGESIFTQFLSTICFLKYALFSVVYSKDTGLHLQSTVLKVSQYSLICCFILVFEKSREIVDANEK